MFKSASFFMIITSVLLLSASGLKAQNPQQAEILRAFEQHEIDAETAILEQFRLVSDLSQKVLWNTGEPHTHGIKCLTPAFMILEQNRQEMSPSALGEISTYMAKTSRLDEQVYVSQSGKFAINYQTTGEDMVPPDDINQNGTPDYVEWVAEAADSSYRHEILTIGFIDPIPAGYVYNIYLSDLGTGLYGYTTTTSGSGPETEFFVDNNFSTGYPKNTDPEGNQKGSVKVTVAHEFKHAIQYATNQWNPPSGNFIWGEMDATLMEEIVYDDVNDYYNYIKQGLESSEPNSSSLFGGPQNSVPGSYNYVSWMLYFAEAYGMDLWKEVWDDIAEERRLGIEEGLARELPKRNASFEEAFVQNHLWHYYSGDRVESEDYGFDEKAFYPNAELGKSFSAVPLEPVVIPGVSKLAARYFEITPGPDDRGVIDAAINMDSTQIGIGMLIYTKTGGVEEYIRTGTEKPQVYFPVEDYTWQNVDRIGVVVTNFSNTSSTGQIELLFGKNGNRFKITDPDFKTRPEQISLYQNYPNPFNPETSIEFDLKNSAKVVLEVFDITGRKVQTLVNENRLFGNYTEQFSGSGLASGVYIYRLQAGNEVKVQKMTLIK